MVDHKHVGGKEQISIHCMSEVSGRWRQVLPTSLQRWSCCSPVQAYTTGCPSWKQALTPPLYHFTPHLGSQVGYMTYRGEFSSMWLGKTQKERHGMFYLMDL